MLEVDTYTELFYHYVWVTKKRECYITSRIEAKLYRYVRDKCRDLGAVVYAINDMQDHMHLACQLPPTITVARFAQVLKGSSAHFINHLDSEGDALAWQPGYAALTFAKSNLKKVARYIENQKLHHAEGTVLPKLERVVPSQSRRDFPQQ